MDGKVKVIQSLHFWTAWCVFSLGLFREKHQHIVIIADCPDMSFVHMYVDISWVSRLAPPKGESAQDWVCCKGVEAKEEKVKVIQSLYFWITLFWGPRGPLVPPLSARLPALKIWINCTAIQIITEPLQTYRTLSGACLVVSGACLVVSGACLVVSDACLVV